MWLEAILTPKDFEDFLPTIIPLEIALEESGKRALFLETVIHVGIAAGQGIVLEAAARLRWTVAGVEVPITIRSARVLLLPTIEVREGLEALVFAMRVEHADFVALPDFVDDTIRTHVNEALASGPARLVWSFTRTLDFHFELPPSMKPARHIDLAAKWGEVRITEEAVILAVSFRAAGSTPAT
jgi:hypothetical protein